MEELIKSARDDGLILFAGAGISMPAPTSLPSWYSINEVILESLTRRLEQFAGPEFSEDVRRQLIATRNNSRYFSPDYQAQIIEDECGPDYFKILQALDTDDRNRCHDAIALLAKSGFVRAIVTTNFDRLIERALDAANVKHLVFRSRDEYEQLQVDAEPVAVIKVHGSVESPETMVDTLRQRLMTRPEALERVIAQLLKRHHVLFAGFSGADLSYDEGYLGLRAAAAENRGFTCLLQPGTKPTAGMGALKQVWGESARYIEAMLPEWFDGLFEKLGVSAPVAPVAQEVDRIGDLRAQANSWSYSLGHMVAVSILAELLESSGRPDLAYQVLVKTYNAAGEDRDPEAKGYSRYNYQLGRRLLERGRFDCPVDPYYGRKAQRDSLHPFTANDCFQCLQRGTSGQFADAFISIGWYEALRGYPESGAERLRAIRGEASKRGALIPFVDACRTLAMIYEILMHYADGLEWLELAHKYARQLGDEPRRARVCAEMARFLAMKGRFGEAHERITEGQAIAERLDLRIARMELWSAEGSVLVEERRGQEAKEKLDSAITAMKEAGFRPALLRTMLDAGYASYQIKDQVSLDRVQDEIYDLADTYPGYSPLVALMMTRLALGTRNTEMAQKMAHEAKRLATMYQNPRAAERAGELEQEARA